MKRARDSITLAAAALFALAATTAVHGAGEATTTSENAQTRTDYEQAVGFIEQGRYSAAIEILEALNAEESENADVVNMLGYAHRKLGQTGAAFRLYGEALAIEPNHAGANEYLGALHLETGDLEGALERLGVLVRTCGESCEERDHLAHAIEAYKDAQGM